MKGDRGDKQNGQASLLVLPTNLRELTSEVLNMINEKSFLFILLFPSFLAVSVVSSESFIDTCLTKKPL